MKTNTFFSTIAALLFTNFAHAGVFIEPYAGYGMGSSTGDYTVTAPVANSGTLDNKDSGVAYGAKLGPSFTMFAFGADFMMTSGKSKPSSGSDSDLKTTNIGAFVGVNAPMIKAALTYFVSSKATLTNSSGTSTELTGNAIKVGAGFTGFPIIAINVDHTIFTYNKASQPATTFGSFSGKGGFTMLSVSAPFDF